MALENKKVSSVSLLINEKIPFSQVLLVGEEKVVLSKQEALQRAKENDLTLLCVAPQANPPVCKLIDYSKYIFELNKKKVRKTNVNKEIRISFVIGENDLRIKLEKIQQWLDKGFAVKVNLIVKSREKTRQEAAYEKCHKIVSELKRISPKIELQGNIRSQATNLYFFLSKVKN